MATEGMVICLDIQATLSSSHGRVARLRDGVHAARVVNRV
jgi:hypothetical protein